jgi:hypothetical protein
MRVATVAPSRIASSRQGSRLEHVSFKSTITDATAAAYLEGTEYIRIYWSKNGAWFLIPGPHYDDPMEPGLGCQE